MDKRNTLQFIDFHSGSIEGSRNIIRRNIQAGLAGAAMAGAGVAGETIALVTGNLNADTTIPGLAAIILGGLLVKDSYDEISSETEHLLTEQAKVTQAQILLGESS